MAFGFQKEKDYERWWLHPFTARACVPGHELKVFESTRLFFHLYWRLLKLGYTEPQLADHAGAWSRLSRLPLELALVVAVFDLALLNSIEAAEPFFVFQER